MYTECMYLADLHIHSRYSRATSRSGDIPNLDLWARRKGLGLVGTGDFTHPAWRDELEKTLQPAEDGLYVIKDEYRLPDFRDFGPAPRFVVSGEISCIYKQAGRVRKVHNVILLPSLDAAERLSLKLEEIGNIRSDGRPILGLSSRDLLAAALDVCPDAIFIPAHIWTPHFSLFGAFSGFESVEECFGDLSPRIRALETGLSSDPLMNRRVPMLDGYVMVSHSDAHSPQKLGRECNIIDAPLSYAALKTALETGAGFAGTVEFFPEEGKYHLDGHRNCGLRLTPEETAACGGKCPVCGKKITVGVLNRVEQLARRSETYVPPDAKPFEHLMPLPEVIAACCGWSETGGKTERLYRHLLGELGPEFGILRDAVLSDLCRVGGERLAEGVRRLRAGEVKKEAGYDGAYGKISLFSPEELRNTAGQLSFLPDPTPAPAASATPSARPAAQDSAPVNRPAAAETADKTANPAQRDAITDSARVIAVIAGPGTGKTFTLTERVANMVESGLPPEEITAVTFTVRAADEMRARLTRRLGRRAEKLTVGTFHAVCLDRLRGEVTLAGRGLQLKTAADVIAGFGLKMPPEKFLQRVSAYKNGVSAGRTVPPSLRGEAAASGCADDSAAFDAYTARLKAAGAVDFDDLLAVALARGIGGRNFTHVLVDEFQDVNEAQYALVQNWLANGKSLFVIGDPDQSIYGFRGAAADCFSRLQADCPDAVTVRLDTNYRSTPQIVRCAAAVIDRNRRPPRTVRPDGPDVRLLSYGSETAEAIGCAKEIARMTGGLDMPGTENKDARDIGAARTFGEIAVLARTHRQLKTIERCLSREGIPAVVAGRASFLDAPCVRGALAFFRAVVCGDPPSEAEAKAYLSCTPDDDGNYVRARERFLPLSAGRPRAVLSAWKEYASVSSPDFDALIEAAHYADMRTFIDAMLLGTEGDVTRVPAPATGGAVFLSTLHGAKGLEFPVVFLVGLDEGVLPSDSAADPDEERRLFYVGLTRAAEELILTASSRPSPFAADLPAAVRREQRRRPDTAQQLSFL